MVKSLDLKIVSDRVNWMYFKNRVMKINQSNFFPCYRKTSIYSDT